MIPGKSIYLRPALISDAPIILDWENNPELWEISETPGPFTLKDIEDFIAQSENLLTSGQTRFLICLKENHSPIGAIDLFDYSKSNRMAGIGIVIANKTMRQKGLAFEALNALVKFGHENLKINTYTCLIHTDNISSQKLFEKINFIPTGLEFFKDRKAIRYQLQLTREKKILPHIR